MKKTMKTKKMNSGGSMMMKKGGKCYAAGGAAKVRLEEADAKGNPIGVKKKKK